MKKTFQVIFFVVIFLIILVGFQALRIYTYGSRTSYTLKPFEQHPSKASLKLLFLGDSTAVGTGSVSNTESVAGWFGHDFPKADITNISKNGKRITQLDEEFMPTPKEHYDLIVVQIGANDVMKLTPIHKINEHLSSIITKAQKVSDHVVIMHSGDVGLAPIFSWPFTWILSERTKMLRTLYINKAAETGVVYIDLFRSRKDDIFLTDINHYYGPDLLHPSGFGYEIWYNSIRQSLQKADILLKN